MILFSFLALRESLYLWLRNPRNIFFGYLLGLSFSFASFALSRSLGHIVHVILLWTNRASWWRSLAPFSGALNTVFIFWAAMLTLIFPAVYSLFSQLEREAKDLRRTKRELEEANRRLRELSQSLEEKVEERTLALALSEEKFRRLFESSGDAIFFCDPEGRLRDINPSGLALLGFAHKEEVLGKSLGEFFVFREDWERYREELCREGRIHNFETEIRTRDGDRRFVIITSDSIDYAEGCRLGCQGIMKDLTAFKEMTRRMIHSEKMAAVGQLAAGIAHEINTPLGIIYGYTQLLREELKEGPPAEDLKKIEEQVRVCQRLIADLLLFSRSSAGEKVPVSLNAIVRQVVEMLEPTYRKSGVRLEVHLAEDLPLISGEEGRLREVLLNLLINARDALEDAGEIHVWTRSDSAEVILEVGDTGCGVPAGIRDRIFEPFFTTKPPGKGTGLGLFVSYGIVRDHGGDIRVLSPPPAEGPYRALGIQTLFRITFPLGGEDA
ncbi:ATP-binding protein [Thermosulfurimonas sp. F29]|uniref:ATP-binding protein n=1 Tax=Thermosulfurimonas sp. F29 TaxID=2867247 RepID=UPI001C83D56F|nr:ATP-binding protein [Thermosulfurimonas sp. F29]MBX6422217.1 PAS domain S-box protein [Thermosulfurimonas sp. F29]